MDPLSVTAGVMTVAGACHSTAKALCGLMGKYRNAQKTILAIHTETTVISASLIQMEGLLGRDGQLTSQLESKDMVKAAFDSGLTGLYMVFQCLDEEVQKLAGYADGTATDWATRARFLWKEDTMKDYLQQLREQEISISLLISLLQT